MVPAEDAHQLSVNCQCPWSSVCEEEPVHLHIPEKKLTEYYHSVPERDGRSKFMHETIVSRLAAHNK